jgi:hypothetical protein
VVMGSSTKIVLFSNPRAVYSEMYALKGQHSGNLHFTHRKI